MQYRALWSGRPAQGLVWRPQDLEYTVIFAVVGMAGLYIAVEGGWVVLALWLSALAYLLVGRFYQDALLRRAISYRLTERGLEIWREGHASAHCTIDLHRLTDLCPQFVTANGRGTVELPPGGWADGPEVLNRWDRLIPALYPCRRLEMIDDVEAAAATIREQASRLRYGTAQPAVR